MTLLEQIGSDVKDAMRAKEESTLSTLRMLKSALKNKEIDLIRPLTEVEVLDVIKSQAKQLKEAIDQFEAGGRSDLAESNKIELEVLKKYMPAELSDADLEAVVKDTLAQSGVSSKADMGKAMGFVMKAVAGRADGTRVKSLVEKMLSMFIFAVLVNTMVVSSAHAEIGTVTLPEFGTYSYLPYLEMGIRLVRVMFLFAGLFSIMEILRGGVEMTVGSVRDAVRDKAEHKIITGFMNIGVVVALFCVTTVVLKQLG
ncbi:MAG: GatB/YqeY domain-containing protein [Candidatus Uhrbacteria bacterium]|nr:GatB/YqeY domain-containing protein [Candidatus Uhrbacteria bacterium]